MGYLERRVGSLCLKPRCALGFYTLYFMEGFLRQTDSVIFYPPPISSLWTILIRCFIRGRLGGECRLLPSPHRNHFYIYFNIMDKILSQNIKNCHKFCSRLDATTFVLRQFNLLFSGCYILQWFIKLHSVVNDAPLLPPLLRCLHAGTLSPYIPS